MTSASAGTFADVGFGKQTAEMVVYSSPLGGFVIGLEDIQTASGGLWDGVPSRDSSATHGADHGGLLKTDAKVKMRLTTASPQVVTLSVVSAGSGFAHNQDHLYFRMVTSGGEPYYLGTDTVATAAQDVPPAVPSGFFVSRLLAHSVATIVSGSSLGRPDKLIIGDPGTRVSIDGLSDRHSLTTATESLASGSLIFDSTDSDVTRGVLTDNPFGKTLSFSIRNQDGQVGQLYHPLSIAVNGPAERNVTFRCRYDNANLWVALPPNFAHDLQADKDFCLSGPARIYKGNDLVISGCHDQAPTDVEVGGPEFAEKYPQGIQGSKLNGKHIITALEDRTSVAAGEVNANGALGSSDEIFARILVPNEYWHNPGGEPSQAAAGTDLAFHQIDMMCCVDVQRRFGDINWQASLDILVLPEQYPGGPLPGNFTEVAGQMY